MSLSQPPESLRNIPIQIIVEGVEITGAIVSLRYNDMSVVILSPVSGLGTGLHVPWLMAGSAKYHLANESGITARGILRAQDLLRELHQFARGRPSGWGISSVSPNGEWTHISPARDSL